MEKSQICYLKKFKNWLIRFEKLTKSIFQNSISCPPPAIAAYKKIVDPKDSLSP
jgi:hypothetical protein